MSSSDTANDGDISSSDENSGEEDFQALPRDIEQQDDVHSSPSKCWTEEDIRLSSTRDKTSKTRQPLEDVEPAESPSGERNNVVEEAVASFHRFTGEKSSIPLSLRTVLRQLSNLNPIHQPADSARLGRTKQQARQLQDGIPQPTARFFKKSTTDCTAEDNEKKLEAFVASPAVGRVTEALDLPKTNDKVPITHISEVEPEPQTYIGDLDGFMAHKTFSLATNPPDGKAVGSKWGFKWKTAVPAK